VRFVPGKPWLIGANVDGVLRLWNIESGRQLQVASLFEKGSEAKWIRDFAVSADGEFLLAERDGALVMFETATLRKVRTLYGITPLQHIALHPSGATALVTLQSGEVLLLRTGAGAGRLVRKFTAADGSLLTAAHFTHDGRHIVTVAPGGKVRVHHTGTGAVLAAAGAPENALIAVTPDSRHVIAAGGPLRHTIGATYDSRMYLLPAKVWQSPVQPGDTLQPLRKLVGHTAPVKSVAFSPVDGIAASGSGWPVGDKTVRVWDVASGRELHCLRGHTSNIMAVAFSQNGKLLASIDLVGDLLLWDPHEGKLIRKAGRQAGFSETIVFLPGGELLTASPGKSQVHIWDVEKGAIARSYNVPPTTVRIAVDRAGNRAALTLRNGDIYCFDVQTGAALQTLSRPSDTGKGANGVFPYAVAMTSNGSQVVAAYRRRVVHWDVASGRVLRFLPAGIFVEGIAITKDDRFVITGGITKQIEVFDLQSGRRVASAAGPLGIRCLDISPAGNELITCGELGGEKDKPAAQVPVQVWRMNPAAWKQ